MTTWVDTSRYSSDEVSGLNLSFLKSHSVRLGAKQTGTRTRLQALTKHSIPNLISAEQALGLA